MQRFLYFLVAVVGAYFILVLFFRQECCESLCRWSVVENYPEIECRIILFYYANEFEGNHVVNIFSSFLCTTAGLG